MTRRPPVHGTLGRQEQLAGCGGPDMLTEYVRKSEENVSGLSLPVGYVNVAGYDQCRLSNTLLGSHLLPQFERACAPADYEQPLKSLL
jgi:hypothetical protein